ncbi:MAG: hypothetical protein FJZ63_04110 [Chlamydiae bacterium]|nr:hypothetical protein [Chlamydiota bacterium]
MAAITLDTKKPFHKPLQETSLESLREPHPATKISKPILERELSSKAPQHVFYRLVTNMQAYVESVEEPTVLRQNQVGEKITTTKKELRHSQEKIANTEKTIETWDFRKKVAQQVLNGVSVISGIGLIATGNPWTGGSLVVSGLGNAASDFMRYMGWNPTLTAATSLVSSVIGVVGGLGGSLVNIYNHFGGSSQALAGAWKSLSYWTNLTAAATGLIGGAVAGGSAVASYRNKDMLSQLEALQSQTSSSLKLLQEKYMSASTGFQNTAKNFSDVFKNIARAQSRYTRDVMRMVTAEFPA